MKPEARFPTILGIAILLIGLVVGVILTNRRTFFAPKAAGSCSPASLQITNLTASSVSISFVTESTCLIGLSVDNRNFLDSSSTQIHYYQVNNLSSGTEYQFALIANGETISRPEYKFKTAYPPVSPLPESNLAWGHVYYPDLRPAAGSIVYLIMPGATPLSALVTSSGNWDISFASSFKAGGSDWFAPLPGQSEDIIVLSPQGTTTEITSNTSQNTPVPDIILGQNTFAPSPVIPADNSSLQSLNSVSGVKNLTISNPNEGELVNALRPQFFGVAPANSRLTIKVESPVVVNGEITASQDGSWTWSPPDNLSSGEHTITVTATNPETGLIETVIRKFVVLATGDQLAFTSSPSASIITPTPTTIITPTLTPTPSPAIMTSSPAGPTNTPAVPVTGNTQPLLLLLVFAVVSIVLSLVVCFYPNRY